MIREIQEQDYSQLSELYNAFFQTHNIFQKDTAIVENYLRKEALERESFLVYEENNSIKGALILVLLGKSADNTHIRWKFRHFAFETEPVALALLQHVENYIKQKSPTAKVELTITENEEGIEFYKKQGYEQEAMLKNHYRWDETCFILGKSIIEEPSKNI
jgi:ribosomal protein S18 acetylase RimI-like enzyme